MSHSLPGDDEDRAPDARLRSLHFISTELSRTRDLDELCMRAVELCTRRLGFDRIGIWLFDLEDPLTKVGTWGTDEEGRPRDERGRRLPRNYVDQRDELYDGRIPYVLIKDAVTYDDRSNPVGSCDKAIASLWDGEKVIGELVADNLLTARGIDAEDGEILALFARTVAHLCALKRSEAALKAALGAKAVLLDELRHRTKNSFAMIGSLISLEAGRAGSDAVSEALVKLRDRVSVMTALYGQLDSSDELEGLRLDEYLRRIAGDLMTGYGAEARSISLSCSTEPIEIDAKRAVPLGLIVNELMTDSLKHAFPAGGLGAIALSLRREEGKRVLLSVADDGLGLPPGFDPRASKGFGITIVEMLCGQIDATLEIGPAARPGGSGRTGSIFLVRFTL